MEKKQTVADLQDREEHLMSKAEKLQMRIAEVQQGSSAQESNIRQETAEEVQ